MTIERIPLTEAMGHYPNVGRRKSFRLQRMLS